jgi:hypothetical protein
MTPPLKMQMRKAASLPTQSVRLASPNAIYVRSLLHTNEKDVPISIIQSVSAHRSIGCRDTREARGGVGSLRAGKKTIIHSSPLQYQIVESKCRGRCGY